MGVKKSLSMNMPCGVSSIISGNRLANFHIIVTNTPPRSGRKLNFKRGEICAYKRGAVRQGKAESFRCRPGKRGRYVAIVQSRREWLTLCEVEVFGKKAPSKICNVTL